MAAREQPVKASRGGGRFGRGVRWGQYLAALNAAKAALGAAAGYSIDLGDHESEDALALVERLERRAWEQFELERSK